jgi:quercetin dioxygenase-like cupin family protein
VVSTELLKKDAGTVTLFAFDKGQGLSEHTAPYDALSYVLDGKAEITISKEPFTLQAGEILLCLPINPRPESMEKFKMLLVMIKK